MAKIGKNIEATQKGNKLILEIDLTKDFGESKSGKSIIIATTNGNKEIAPGVIAGINIYKKADE